MKVEGNWQFGNNFASSQKGHPSSQSQYLLGYFEGTKLTPTLASLAKMKSLQRYLRFARVL